MKKYLRCKDIEKSLYIAPNEIRSCCQRFFYNGKMRGDAQLLKIENGKTEDLIKIAKVNNIKTVNVVRRDHRSWAWIYRLYVTRHLLCQGGRLAKRWDHRRHYYGQLANQTLSFTLFDCIFCLFGCVFCSYIFVLCIVVFIDQGWACDNNWRCIFATPIAISV